MGDGWAWAQYLYGEDDDMTMSNQFEDDKVMNAYTKGCYCGNPDRPGWAHYNTGNIMCAAILSEDDIDHLAANIIRGMRMPDKEPDPLPQDQIRVTRKYEAAGPHGQVSLYTLEVTNLPNEQARRVMLNILPKVIELYLNKSKDYGGNVMDRFGLGQKASIPDMARKFGKLIDAIWYDKPLQFEQPNEILADLIGHILIILDERDRSSLD